jgi:putative methionine-R-sulfoxide reductase with GAF domain
MAQTSPRPKPAAAAPRRRRRPRSPPPRHAARDQPGAVGHAQSESRLSSHPRNSRRHHGAERGIVSLLQADGELRIEASDGITAGPRTVTYQLGEGITGRVVQSGKPIVVPSVSREPAFLHRAARRPELAHEELSFICVPILLNRRAVGALAIDLKFDPARTFNRSVTFLGVVASLTHATIGRIDPPSRRALYRSCSACHRISVARHVKSRRKGSIPVARSSLRSRFSTRSSASFGWQANLSI